MSDWPEASLNSSRSFVVAIEAMSETLEEIARDIMDTACLGEPFVKNGCDAQLRKDIEIAIREAEERGRAELEADVSKLRSDLKRACEQEVYRGCEQCGAPLFDGEGVSDEDGVSGCWPAMADKPANNDCWAYRVGKESAPERYSARAALNEEAVK